MTIYYVLASVVLLIQAVLLVEAHRHLLYTRRKYRPRPLTYMPRVALISPCKGLDNTFDRNIHSFLTLDYPNYELVFVVESQDDPAYQRLLNIIEQNRDRATKINARVIVAGHSKTSVQKVHNLLAACDAIGNDVEVLAFVDSDACVKSHFLGSLIHPLRRDFVGATTGYRWFVPTDSAWASRVLSAINAVIASMMGPHSWNATWGGAMAIRREVFKKTRVRDAWANACTDDYSLTNAVRKENLRITFVPACYVASYEQTTWAKMFSFARRQFLITRVLHKKLWIFALLGFGYFVVAFWASLFISLYLFASQSPHAPYAAILPAALMACSMAKGHYQTTIDPQNPAGEPPTTGNTGLAGHLRPAPAQCLHFHLPAGLGRIPCDYLAGHQVHFAQRRPYRDHPSLGRQRLTPAHLQASPATIAAVISY